MRLTKLMRHHEGPYFINSICNSSSDKILFFRRVTRSNAAAATKAGNKASRKSKAASWEIRNPKSSVKSSRFYPPASLHFCRSTYSLPSSVYYTLHTFYIFILFKTVFVDFYYTAQGGYLWRLTLLIDALCPSFFFWPSDDRHRGCLSFVCVFFHWKRLINGRFSRSCMEA